MQETGYVYILTNPSFREDWVKIGKSSLFADILPGENVNAFVPFPFEIYATIQSVNYHEIERLVHNMLGRLTDLKVQSDTGFFKISPRKVFEVFCDIAEAIDDAEVIKCPRKQPQLLSGEEQLTTPILDESEVECGTSYVEEEAFVNSECCTPKGLGKKYHYEPGQRFKRCRFRFSLIGIEVGQLVRFDETGLMVRVVSDNEVEHEGKVYKLSRFVREFLPSHLQNTSGAYQGSKYFSYHGRILEDLRKEKEAKESASAKT